MWPAKRARSIRPGAGAVACCVRVVEEEGGDGAVAGAGFSVVDGGTITSSMLKSGSISRLYHLALYFRTKSFLPGGNVKAFKYSFQRVSLSKSNFLQIVDGIRVDIACQKTKFVGKM